MTDDESSGNYFKFLLSPFFVWWWAVLTGIASILSYFEVPIKGIHLSKLQTSLLVGIVLLLIFVVISVFSQSHKLFLGRDSQIIVDSFLRVQNHHTDYQVILTGSLPQDSDIILPIYRVHDGAELLFFYAKVIRKTSEGKYQAEPIWISPGQLRDFKKKDFSERSLKVKRYVGAEPRLVEAIRELG